MPARRLNVVLTRRLPERVETRMAELFELTRWPEERPMTRQELSAALREADVLVPSLSDRLDQSLLAGAGEQLRLIANFGAGVDHIDVATARQRGILVSNTPDVATEDTADMTMALILALLRRIPEGLDIMRSGDWPGWSPDAMMGTRVAGRQIGILGMGRIGQAVARRAGAFGMQVHYHNRNRLPEATELALGARYHESLDQMVRRVDVISINCPHTPSTYHLMNARRLGQMKPGAVIVNTSRGEVIDESALTRLLRAGDIAGAGLDVVMGGSDASPDLHELPNVVLLPHMASATVEGRLEMGEKVILNIKTFADGHRPPDLVVPAMS